MSERWYDQMACRNSDPDMFVRPNQQGMVPKGGRTDKWAIPALLLCRSCPVRLQCLEEHLSADETYRHDGSELHHPIIHVPMVVGGLLPQQVDELRARRRRSA